MQKTKVAVVSVKNEMDSVASSQNSLGYRRIRVSHLLKSHVSPLKNTL